jgi:hypothetical protein
MAPITENPDRADVNDGSLISAVVSVGTTAVELKAGASRNPRRQGVHVYVDSNNVDIYTGPAGVTASGAAKGIPLNAGGERWFPVGDVAVWAITSSGTTNVIVQEYV